MGNFLTEQERERLKAQHRQEKNRRTADRIKAVLAADAGMTYRQIAQVLLLDEETISQHLKDYRGEEKLSVETGGRVEKLDAQAAQELVAHVEATTYLKVQDICAHVRETYQIEYTVAGMTAWLHRHGFSYKKPSPTPAKADPQAQAAFVETYEKLLKTVNENEPILFADAVHPTMATKVAYGWIKRGEEKPIATTSSRTRMNIMGVLELETMRLITKDYDTINSASLVDYWCHLRTTYPPDKHPKIHIILDRGPYNISQETQEGAKKQGIVLHYLPPYSPNLNPIERVWKVMNEQVRNNRYFASAKAFREAITQFFEETWGKIAWSLIDRINDIFQTIQKPVLA